MDDLYFAGGQNASSRLDELDACLVRRDDVASLLQAGQKINAIKIYREDTGASLSDAKTAIERMELGLRLYGAGVAPLPGFQEKVSLAGASIPAYEIDMEALQVEVEHLLIQGRKINAIKLYRERTGLGLREAKDAIDLIENTLLVRGPSPLTRAQTVEVNPNEEREINMEALTGEIERLLIQNEKIKAIKLYRERTGLGLREAKDAVEQIERHLRARDFPAFHPPKSGRQKAWPEQRWDTPSE